MVAGSWVGMSQQKMTLFFGKGAAAKDAAPSRAADRAAGATTGDDTRSRKRRKVVASEVGVPGHASRSSTTAASTAAAASTATALPPSLLPPLKAGERMHSTKLASAAKRKWLVHAPDKSRDPARAYCSTDGSSSGWHAAVFVAAGADVATLRARWADCLGSRNVGAEAFGFSLGVETLPPTCRDCVFLADFLNALAWDCGAAKYKHPAIVEAFDGQNGVGAYRRRVGHTPATSRWDHVHHPGHQTDSSWFTQLNQVADNLASCAMDVEVTVPLEVLASLTVQGKKATELCKAAIAEHTPGR